MDKEIIEVIAEMLIKQDETNRQVEKNNRQLGETNRQLGETNKKIEETNNILKDFMEVSILQCKVQHRFNGKLDDKLTELVNLEDRVKHLEGLEARVEKIEKTLKAS